MKKVIKLLPVLALVAVLGACDRDAEDREATMAANAEAERDTAGDTAPGAGAAADPAVPSPNNPTGAVGAPAGSTAGTTAGGMAGTMAASERERGALGVLNAINEHEIAAGEQALARSVPEDVAAYARMMVEQHSENRDKTNQFGPNAGDPKATAQRDKGAAELKALAAKSDNEYAKAYVDAMVKGHTEALATLDNNLIPAAESDAVRTHLTTTRGHVADHLERAKALQKSTGSR